MTTLAGHVPPSHPLSPRRAFRDLRSWVRRGVDLDPTSLWEQDTAALPRALGAYRRRVRRFAETALAPAALRIDADGDHAGADAVVRAAAREGLYSDLLPWPLGSLSPALAHRPPQWVQSVKMEELCAACGGLGLMIGAHGLGAMPILLAGDRRLVRRHFLPALRACAAGEPRLFAFAITEPAAGSDVEDGEGASRCRPGTVARRVSGGWRLRGRKVFISGGDLAHAVTVFAALEGEGMESWTCFLVLAGTEGFVLGRNELKMGQRASSATELVFDDAFVPDDRVVGGLRRGWAINRAVLDFSRIPVGAIALGIARGALDRTVAFARDARLAGRSLLDFQDVQIRVAQMLGDVAAMRALVWQSGSRWRPNQAKASMTKVFCSDTAVRVCEDAMELLGNHAVLASNGVEKAYRDARLTQIYEGTNQINRLSAIEDQMAHFAGRGPYG